MPHFHLEYSANLEAMIDIGALCEAIRDTAAKIDIFPLAGIRVRAIRVDHYAIADGNAKHGFIDLSIRLREGRSETAKKDAVEKIFDCLRAFMDPFWQLPLSHYPQKFAISRQRWPRNTVQSASI